MSTTIKKAREELSVKEAELHDMETDEFQKRQSMNKVIPSYNQFKSWADHFEQATLEQKKMIACQLFSRIEIGQDYKINCILNMTYQQFCTEWSEVESIVRVAM